MKSGDRPLRARQYTLSTPSKEFRSRTPLSLRLQQLSAQSLADLPVEHWHQDATDFAPFSGTEFERPAPTLTDTFERCYVPELALLAGVAKLAYAADSKSAGLRSVGVQVPPPASIKSFNSNGLQAGFSVVCARSTSFAPSFYGTAKRSPTFKIHHFWSLGAHKELEVFLRENLSNNFRCWFPGNADSSPSCSAKQCFSRLRALELLASIASPHEYRRA